MHGVRGGTDRLERAKVVCLDDWRMHSLMQTVVCRAIVVLTMVTVLGYSRNGLLARMTSQSVLGTLSGSGLKAVLVMA